MAQDQMSIKADQPLPAGSEVSSAEFDRFSDDYQRMLDQTVRITGEKGDYFAELKARYLVALQGSTFAGTVLEFGCGVGLLSQHLLRHFPACRLHGFDVSRSSLDMIPLAISARARFTAIENELSSDYDLIVTANVMHHIPPPERQDALGRMQKRLAKGGRLVVFEHNPLNPLTRIAVKQCPFDEGVSLLWPGELLNYFKGAGLSLEKRDYITFFPRALAWLRPFESGLAWCPLGAQYVMVGRQNRS